MSRHVFLWQSAALTHLHFTLKLNEVSKPVTKALAETSSYLPAVVVNMREPTIAPKELALLLDHFAGIDDVYQPYFTKSGIVILQCLRDKHSTPKGFIEPKLYLRQASGNTRVHASPAIEHMIPEGSYFVHHEDCSFHQAWRL